MTQAAPAEARNLTGRWPENDRLLFKVKTKDAVMQTRDRDQPSSASTPTHQDTSPRGRHPGRNPIRILKKRTGELKRFAMAGAINTIIGASAIFALQALTSRPYLSNALGYLFAGIWAYFLQSSYTFKARRSKRSFALFALISASGYALNAVVLNRCLPILGPFAAQIAAVTSYAVYSYILQSNLAFPSHLRNVNSGQTTDTSARCLKGN